MPAVRAILLYAVLTVALTWPFAANLRVMDAGDSAFFAWEIGWTVHALKTDPASLPHGNIFHPLRYTLGMDEPVFGTTLLVLPLALVSDDAVLLYNVVRLLTFLASALSAWWLARELGASEWMALAAGALFAFSPIRTDQVAHLSTLGTQWWPLVLLFTIRFAKRGRPADALVAALAFVLAFLACGYHGVIAAAVLPPVLAVLFWGRWDRLKWGAAAAVLAGLALFPLYRMHQKALEPERYARGTEETIQYSAPLESLRLRYIENATSTESSTRHGAGSLRSSVYSQGRAPAWVRARFTPAVYASSRSRSSAGLSFTIARAIRRKSWMRYFSSSSSTGLPSSSASSPAAARRMRSIWKKRS